MYKNRKHLLTSSVCLVFISYLFLSRIITKRLLNFINLSNCTPYIHLFISQVVPSIQSNGVLNIRIASATLNPDSNILFNRDYSLIYNQTFWIAQMTPNVVHFVNVDSNVNLSIMDKAKISGLTCESGLARAIQKVFKAGEDSIINEQSMNFGEVKHTGVLSVQNKCVNVLEVLGLAGRIPSQAIENKLLNGHKKNRQNSLQCLSITNEYEFNNATFYRQQNDLWYVRSFNRRKIEKRVYEDFKLFHIYS